MRQPYGKTPYGRPLTGGPLREHPLRGGTPSLTGPLRGEGPYEKLVWNFCLCAVDQKKPFLIRAGPFLDLLPNMGLLRPFWPSRGRPLIRHPYGKTPYREAPYKNTPYGKTPYGEAPYENTLYGEHRPLRDPYGEAPYEKLGWNFCLYAVDRKKAFLIGAGPFLNLLPIMGLTGQAQN